MTALVAPRGAQYALALALAVALGACERGSGAGATTRGPTSDSMATAATGLPVGHPSISSAGAPLPATAQRLLDSGNVAFRAKRHEAALRHYRAAAAAAPNHPAPLFGVHMAGGALGDSALADSALARLRAVSPQGLPPGESAKRGAAAPKP